RKRNPPNHAETIFSAEETGRDLRTLLSRRTGRERSEGSGVSGFSDRTISLRNRDPLSRRGRCAQCTTHPTLRQGVRRGNRIRDSPHPGALETTLELYPTHRYP